jgi:hypothetical protein
MLGKLKIPSSSNKLFAKVLIIFDFASNDEIALDMLLAHYKLRLSLFRAASPFLASPERA